MCCGENKNNRLGVDDTICTGNQRKFIPANFGTLKSVDAYYEICVIDPSGQLWINGAKHLEGKKVKFTTSGGSSNKVSYYAVDNDNKLYSWGDANASGQLGNGTTDA